MSAPLSEGEGAGGSAQVHLLVAQEAMKMELDIRACEFHYRKATELAPQHAAALYAYGSVLSALQRHEVAAVGGERDVERRGERQEVEQEEGLPECKAR